MELCLSLFPHWAWSIVHGRKRIENRTWRTRHRGRLWIHSSTTKSVISPADMSLLGDMPDPSLLPRGAIIGSVHVVDCVPLADVAGDVYAFGPWCWVLERPKAIRPIPCLGSTKLWHMPQKVQRVALHTRSLR